VKGFLEAGRQEGAEVVTGGKVVGYQGYFVEPTVLARTDRSMKVVRKEIFEVLQAAEHAFDGVERAIEERREVYLTSAD
jgi:acyl-CoA reductase-like NAD-dependent aldehyde dehydrogenase